MVVDPFLTKVTIPVVSLMVATAGLLEDHVTLALGISTEEEFLTTADKEPAAVPVAMSVLVMPEASIVTEVASAVLSTFL